MTKTKIIETTERYDENGKLIEKIIREETITDSNNTQYMHTSTPITLTEDDKCGSGYVC